MVFFISYNFNEDEQSELLKWEKKNLQKIIENFRGKVWFFRDISVVLQDIRDLFFDNCGGG
jgi:hypothetical protein